MTRCRAWDCNADLMHVEGPSGKTMPLRQLTAEERAAPPWRTTFYRLETPLGVARAVPVVDLASVGPETPVYLNHFVDCKAREQFRRRR